jgi:uncharacterized protein Yka (UPF0111/DUF47 family)
MSSLEEAIEKLEKSIDEIKDDLIDHLFLTETLDSSVNIYAMSYEEYSELPYRSRL